MGVKPLEKWIGAALTPDLIDVLDKPGLVRLELRGPKFRLFAPIKFRGAPEKPEPRFPVGAFVREFGGCKIEYGLVYRIADWCRRTGFPPDWDQWTKHLEVRDDFFGVAKDGELRDLLGKPFGPSTVAFVTYPRDGPSLVYMIMKNGKLEIRIPGAPTWVGSGVDRIWDRFLGKAITRQLLAQMADEFIASRWEINSRVWMELIGGPEFPLTDAQKEAEEDQEQEARLRAGPTGMVNRFGPIAAGPTGVTGPPGPTRGSAIDTLFPGEIAEVPFEKIRTKEDEAPVAEKAKPRKISWED